MRQEIVSVSTAKAKLLKLVRAMEEEGRGYILTKDGRAVGALLPIEDYEAYSETFEVMNNAELMKDLEEALTDERKGRLWERDKKGKWVRFRK